MRRYEWLLAAYFTYTGILACILPIRAQLTALTVTLNLTILATYALLVYADRLRPNELLSIIRDWFPFPLALLSYREMGWFAQPHLRFDLENAFIRWDRLVLRDWGLHRAIELLGPVLPALLEIAYMLTYALAPFAVAMLYAYRHRERVDRLLFPFLLAVLFCYVQFPFWPSEPPRAVFPGEDFPGVITVFRRFNWTILGAHGIHTSVFPSAHVAGSLGTALATLGALPEHPWVGRILLVTAILIAIATVYGRYHYVADAAAGLVMCMAGFAVNSVVRKSD